MKKSGFMKDALILFVITLVSGALLGGVYEMTKIPIQSSKMAASLEAYKRVYADAADFKFNQDIQDLADDSAELLAVSGENLGNVKVTVALDAVDASGNVIGHIMSSESNDGYGGAIRVSVGVTKEGEVTGMEILEMAETPGLGMRAGEPEFTDQFKGKNVDLFKLTKTGKSADDEIDALSGATITSSAVTNAVNAAVYFAKNCIEQ